MAHGEGVAAGVGGGLIRCSTVRKQGGGGEREGKEREGGVGRLSLINLV